MTKLTANQKTQLQQLKNSKSLYVGYNSPSIMRTFDALVDKGYAKVTEITPGYGKRYTAI